MLNYKGYLGKVEFDPEAKVLHGEVLGTRDVITFAADSASKIETAFRESIDDYLDFCAERDEKPEKPASGRFIVRLPPTLHREVNQIAEAEGKSINAFVQEAIQDKRDQFWTARSKAKPERSARHAKTRSSKARR